MSTFRLRQGDTFQVPADTTLRGTRSHRAEQFPDTPLRYILDRRHGGRFQFSAVPPSMTELGRKIVSKGWFTLFAPEGIKPGDWLHVVERDPGYAVVRRASPDQVLRATAQSSEARVET